MSVYVDDLIDYSERMSLPKRMRREWCHLTADSEEELRVFARRLGLKAEWIQYPGVPHRVHFDLAREKRAKAVSLGAVEEDRHQMVLRQRPLWDAARESRNLNSNQSENE